LQFAAGACSSERDNDVGGVDAALFAAIALMATNKPAQAKFLPPTNSHFLWLRPATATPNKETRRDARCQQHRTGNWCCSSFPHPPSAISARRPAAVFVCLIDY